MHSTYTYKLNRVLEIVLLLVWISSIATLYVVSDITASLHFMAQAYTAEAFCAFDAFALVICLIFHFSR